MLDNEEPTSFTFAPPPSLRAKNELDERKLVYKRLGACSLSPVGERKADSREETLHTVTETAETLWYCLAMRAIGSRLGKSLT